MSLNPQPETPKTPQVTTRNQSSYENMGRMDEIGIPVFDECNSPRNFPITELSSPIMIRKLRNQNGDLPKIPLNLPASPIGSPYENLYYNRNFKPKSPNTQSPRTRIKTTFAHKNLPSPQYFIFPTPPPTDNTRQPNFDTTQTKPTPPKVPEKPDYLKKQIENAKIIKESKEVPNEEVKKSDENFAGIEKQLSLEEEIPMIDDTDVIDDIEFRTTKVIPEAKPKEEFLIPIEVDVEVKVIDENQMSKNKSFDDVKKELMADIPELEEFEKDLKDNSREKILNNLTECVRTIDLEAESPVGSYSDDNIREMKLKYETLKEERKKILSEIHEYKSKMSEIRSQEDDILREVSTLHAYSRHIFPIKELTETYTINYPY